MEWLILGFACAATYVIARDFVRERRWRASRPDIAGAIVAGLAAAAPATAAAPLRDLLGDQGGLEVGGEPGGLWAAMAERIDPSSWFPQLAAGVEVMEFPSRSGNDYALVRNPEGDSHYTLEIWEARLAQLMDGTRSIKDLILLRLEEEGDLDPAAIAALITMLRVEGLLEPRAVNAEVLLRERIDPSSPGRRKLKEFAKTLRLRWMGAERFTRWAYGTGLRFAWSRPGALACTAVAAIGMVLFVLTVRSGTFSFNYDRAPIETTLLIVLSFFLTFCHELAHAMALVHNRRRVISAGFLVFFGSPAFFVDASDGQMIPRRGRIFQAFAGPFAELVLCGVASVFLFLFPESPAAPLLYRFNFVGYIVIFENLIPLIKLDGYWILSDLIGEPTLREVSTQYLRHELWDRIRNRKGLTPYEWSLVVFALLGTAFAISMTWIGLVFWQQLFGEIVANLWRGGWGTRLLLIAFVLVFGGPLIRAGIDALRAVVRRAKAGVAAIRFRLEQSWRVEAAELIGALPAFGELDEDVLSDLAGRVQLDQFSAGQPVFRQGDQPEAFYVVRSGAVAVEDVDPDTGNTRILRTLGRGDSFGELGLLDMAPRSATIRAIEETQLFVVGKSAFDRLLADAIEAPKFAPSMQNFAELRALPTFRRLATDRLAEVLEHGEWRTFVAGDVIIEQGEPGDAFYAIQRGQADVAVDGEFVRTLGQGSYFGELALLNDTPRTATVTAASAMRVFRLDREGFEQVVAEQFEGSAIPAHYRRSMRDMEH
ncbi:MAG: cyclic nucleotide-binding domain-containing protein [Actinomycetota bacterium]